CSNRAFSSGRRLEDQSAGVVTFVPSNITSGSGISGRDGSWSGPGNSGGAAGAGGTRARAATVRATVRGRITGHSHQGRTTGERAAAMLPARPAHARPLRGRDEPQRHRGGYGKSKLNLKYLIF